MKRKTVALVAALLIGGAGALPTFALEAPKLPVPTQITKVSAPMNHQFKLGKVTPKHQSLPQTSWVCYTPAGTCYVPGLGYCYCCFAGWGCYNGST